MTRWTTMRGASPTFIGHQPKAILYVLTVALQVRQMRLQLRDSLIATLSCLCTQGKRSEDRPDLRRIGDQPPLVRAKPCGLPRDFRRPARAQGAPARRSLHRARQSAARKRRERARRRQSCAFGGDA